MANAHPYNSGNGYTPTRGDDRASRENDSTQAVLIVSDDPEFARTVVARWQSERTVPAFTLVGSGLPSGAMSAEYCLAIVGPHVGRSSALLSALESSGAAVVCVSADDGLEKLRIAHPRAHFVRQLDGWLDVLVQLASEVLRRSEAFDRMQYAEEAVLEANRHAMLGRYILEMRHTLNNCLTSVLGNAELLLMEPGNLGAEGREQVQTMHNMALRMHEVLQRFSSLESEMQVAEKKSHSETAPLSHARALSL